MFHRSILVFYSMVGAFIQQVAWHIFGHYSKPWNMSSSTFWSIFSTTMAQFYWPKINPFAMRCRFFSHHAVLGQAVSAFTSGPHHGACCAKAPLSPSQLAEYKRFSPPSCWSPGAPWDLVFWTRKTQHGRFLWISLVFFVTLSLSLSIVIYVSISYIYIYLLIVHRLWIQLSTFSWEMTLDPDSDLPSGSPIGAPGAHSFFRWGSMILFLSLWLYEGL